MSRFINTNRSFASGDSTSIFKLNTSAPVKATNTEGDMIYIHRYIGDSATIVFAEVFGETRAVSRFLRSISDGKLTIVGHVSTGISPVFYGSEKLRVFNNSKYTVSRKDNSLYGISRGIVYSDLLIQAPKDTDSSFVWAIGTNRDNLIKNVGEQIKSINDFAIVPQWYEHIIERGLERRMIQSYSSRGMTERLVSVNTNKSIWLEIVSNGIASGDLEVV